MTKTLIQHFGIALLILAISFVLFTLLPDTLPHPEDFSPWAYLVAFIASVIAWLLLPRNASRWLYAGIVLLCTLALLDESGYGVEIFGWQPLYLEQYHVEIHDLHNLAALGFELLGDFLEESRWNAAQFTSFMLFNAALLALGLIQRALLRQPAGFKSLQRHHRITSTTAAAIALVGLAAATYLALLPSDEKNSLLLGYSAVRLGSMAVILAGSLAPIAALAFVREAAYKWAERFMDATARWLPWIGLAAVIGLIAYQVNSTFVFLPDEQARLERITPLVFWLATELIILGLAGLAWQERWQATFIDMWRNFVAFLRQQPAFLYAGFAVLLILIAQLIDQNIIPLNEWIVTPNFHVALWGLWTEELFEMTGAFFFLAAAWFFPRPHSAYKKTLRK